MHPLQKRFHDFVQENKLVKKDEPVLLAVSGGVDSMVMLHLFLQTHYKVHVAHCNFGLRGKDSDDDEKLVTSFSNERRVECHVKRIELGKGSIQLQARNARYEWFDELCEQYELSKIATAHHLDDSLETTMLNLARGTGIKGIEGISIRSGRVIRPLLFAAKEELIDYAKEQGLEWREDVSNQKSDYQRNKIRLEIIPKLKELNPSLITTYQNTRERLMATSFLLAEKVNEVKHKYFDQDSLILKLGWVKSINDLLILSEILSDYGFNYVTSREVFGSIGQSGKIFPAEQYTVYMDRSELFIQENEEQKNLFIIIPSEGSYQVGQHRFQIEQVELNGLNPNQGSNVAFFDHDKIIFPLKIRKWREGEYFRPLGMKGSKKISDFLIDEKVPLAKKDSVMVLEVNHQIAWVVGMRISDTFKITDKTKKLLQITKST